MTKQQNLASYNFALGYTANLLGSRWCRIMKNSWCAVMTCLRVRYLWKHQGLPSDSFQEWDTGDTSSPGVCSRMGSQTSMVQHSQVPHIYGLLSSRRQDKTKRLQLPCVLKQVMSPQSYSSSHQGGTHPLPCLQWELHTYTFAASNRRCASRARALMNSLHDTKNLFSSRTIKATNTAGLSAGIAVS